MKWQETAYTVSGILYEREQFMKRVIGFALFFTGIGILIGLIAPDGIVLTLIAAICLLIGYNLCCCC